MATFNDLRTQERRRAAILNAVKLAGPSGLVLDEDYSQRMEVDHMVVDQLIAEMPGQKRRFRMTDPGKKALKRLVAAGLLCLLLAGCGKISVGPPIPPPNLADLANALAERPDLVLGCGTSLLAASGLVAILGKRG